MSIRIACILFAAALAASSPNARADDIAGEENGTGELPLWEVGLFGGAGRLPHYRGSDEYKTYFLPLPFFIYRGEVFRANREGVKSIFWENDRLETGLSMSGNPPVDDDNLAREGMPELGAIGEIGPMLKGYLRERRHPNPFYAVAAVRMAISADPDNFHTAHEGFRGDVRLVYRNYTRLEKWKVVFGLNAAVDFADAEGQRYFYEVEPDYATSERPAYSPHGGYSGFSLSANATKSLNSRLKLGVYYRWDNLAGSSYEDSPLVMTENNHIVGAALIWNIHRSEKKSSHASL